MNDINHQSAVQDAVKTRFRGSETKTARILPRYPLTADREYQRLSRAYVRVLSDALKEHLPAIVEAYKQERTDSRFDSSYGLEQKLKKELLAIAADVEKNISKFDLDEHVKKIANLATAQSTREWKRVVKKTLGIDLMDDYYKGEMYSEALQRWVASNIASIKSIPNETLGNLEQVILDGYKNGKSLTKLREDIQATYDVSKRKAELLARDQVSTLNSEFTKMQQTDAGVKSYKWSSSLDSRVRPCHAELHGKVFSWDDPPEMWYETKNGIVYTGRCCHPGEDYCCRCVAIPIFDIQTVDVPMKGKS